MIDKECSHVPSRSPLHIAAVIALALFGTQVYAHQINSSYTSVLVTPESLTVTVSIELAGLNRMFLIDRNGDSVVTNEEVAAAMPGMYDFVQNHFMISADFSPLSMNRRAGGFNQNQAGAAVVDFVFFKTLNHVPSKISLSADFFDKFGDQHKNLVKVMYGNRTQQGILTAGSPHQDFPITGDLPFASQLLAFVKLGVEHIFLGYDHIMFLLALILVGGTLGNLIKIVTSFTVAHSITLILSALQVVVLPSQVTECGIAASIAYVAAENLVIKKPDHRWIITFCFGLVHGFGFASILRSLGLPAKGLVSSLLSFNVGVEIGQMCIVAVLFPLVLLLQRLKSKPYFVFAFSTVIFLFGAGWFIERAFKVAFMPF
jgi:hypothetical protein